ncbi:MAG: hypothetical protein ACR2L1_00475 [Pyrinomonadaceae bacterium]
MSAILKKMPETEMSEEQAAQSSAPETTGELELANWSVITFEGVAVSGLTYEEARKWLGKLSEQKISGLCIVTDEAAARMAK